jgi:MOSC domain-containing protein YiiM
LRGGFGESSTEWEGAMMTATQIRIERLYISPGHNFRGHHGQAAGEHLIVERKEIHCVARRGIEDDRYFDYKPDFKGQITFFSLEVFEEVCGALGVQGKSPGVLRRNVMTRGVDLNLLIDTEFVLQGVRFAGVEECSPCYWMELALAPGAEAALRGRGGLRARILSGGALRSGI